MADAWKGGAGWGCVIALALCGAGVGCGSRDPETSVGAQDAAIQAAPAATPDAAAAPDPEITRILGELRGRQTCNRVTGCAPLTALLQRPDAALGEVTALLRKHGGGDGYWIEMALEFLGQSDRAAALEALAPFVRDRRWTVRLRAVMAVGRLHRHASATTRELLGEASRMAAASRDAAWQAAILQAQLRLEPSRTAELEPLLLALYPTDPGVIQTIAPPVLDWLVMVATEARLSRAAPLLRGACLSDNRFVAISALTGAAALRDTGAVPFALTRLEDPQPGIRRAALLALQTITGSRTIDMPDAWRSWAAQQGLAALPAEWAGGWRPGPAETSPPPVDHMRRDAPP